MRKRPTVPGTVAPDPYPLEAVIASEAYSPAEHAYFRALLRRLRLLELSGSDRIEDRLDAVHCALGDGDPAAG